MGVGRPILMEDAMLEDEKDVTYHIKKGPNGLYYAVFCCESCLIAYEEQHPDHFNMCYTVCFGSYCNAFELGTIH